MNIAPRPWSVHAHRREHATDLHADGSGDSRANPADGGFVTSIANLACADCARHAMAARRAGKGGQFRRIPSTAGCLGVGTTIAMDVAGPVMNRLPLQRTLVEWTLSATALATV